MAATTDTEVSVLPQQTRIFLVDANNVLDDERSTIVLSERTRLHIIT